MRYQQFTFTTGCIILNVIMDLPLAAINKSLRSLQDTKPHTKSLSFQVSMCPWQTLQHTLYSAVGQLTADLNSRAESPEINLN